MNWAEFFHMGGHGFYVWGTYLIATVVMVFNVVLPLRRYRRQQQKLKQTN